MKMRNRATDVVAELTAQVESLKARLEVLEGKRPETNGSGGPQSRRDVLKLAGAAAAGAAGTIMLRGIPAEATSGSPVVLGNSTTNDAAATTTIFPTSGTAPAPLFQATGQGVSPSTTVPATVSTTGAPLQSVPLIGAIGPSGTLPTIGGVTDYPGYAPIQGVGGAATIAIQGGTEFESEGVNGWGHGSTGKGVTGESDIGYGVTGGSGGIDFGAIGTGRIQQFPLPAAGLTDPNGIKGPPNYTPNDFELARDANGLLYMSVFGGTWLPVQVGGLNQALFTAVTNKLLALYGPADGNTFVDMMPDAANGQTGGPDLVLNITPGFDCVALITGNASLYNGTTGHNQDLGIYVSPSAPAQNIVAWVEAGQPDIDLPNAAFVQAVFPMTNGTAYNVRLKWKPNISLPAGGVIRAGAGPFPAGSGSGSVSPTRLTVLLIVTA